MQIAMAVSNFAVFYSVFKKQLILLHKVVDSALNKLVLSERDCLVDVFLGLREIFVPVSLYDFKGTVLFYFGACLYYGMKLRDFFCYLVNCFIAHFVLFEEHCHYFFLGQALHL